MISHSPLRPAPVKSTPSDKMQRRMPAKLQVPWPASPQRFRSFSLGTFWALGDEQGSSGLEDDEGLVAGGRQGISMSPNPAPSGKPQGPEEEKHGLLAEVVVTPRPAASAKRARSPSPTSPPDQGEDRHRR